MSVVKSTHMSEAEKTEMLNAYNNLMRRLNQLKIEADYLLEDTTTDAEMTGVLNEWCEMIDESFGIIVADSTV